MANDYLYRRKHEEYFFWETIGAENNYLPSQKYLSRGLIDWGINYYPVNNEEKQRRGIFWLYTYVTAEDNTLADLYSAVKDLEEEGYTLKSAKPPDDSLFDYDYAGLSPVEIAVCREGALQGSGKAALVTAQYYHEIVNDPDSDYWYQIGAQNGNVECMRQFGNILAGKNGYLDQERGKFWLERADYGHL